MNAAIVQEFDERPFASLIVIGNRHGRGDIGGARHHGRGSNAAVTSSTRTAARERPVSAVERVPHRDKGWDRRTDAALRGDDTLAQNQVVERKGPASLQALLRFPREG
jgi:hypothetical protein